MELNNEEIVLAYTGSEISANILIEYLAASDIHSIVKNVKNSSLTAGYDTATRCEVYIFEKDEEKAQPLIDEFYDNNR